MKEANEFRSAIEATRNNSSSELTEMVEEWLSHKWVVPKEYAREFFKIQASTYFLLVWPIFEHDVCNGFMDTRKILNVAKTFKDCYNEMDVDVILKKFFDRYKTRNNPDSHWNSLCHDDYSVAKSSAERVLNKDWSKCDPVAKLQFGLYVIYRFRNNIFHGNKTIFEWLNNREQIEDCVIVLLRLTEFYDKIKNEARAST